MLIREEFNNIRKVMPYNNYMLLKEEIKKGRIITDIEVFEKEILYQLRKMTTQQIADLPDVSEGLEYSIKKVANSCNKVSELISMVKTKRFTQTRIQRILLYALLGITKKDMLDSKKIVPYIRVLGMNNNGKEMLSDICTINPKIQIVTSVKKYIDNNYNKNLIHMLEKDIFATNVYTLGYEGQSLANLDYTNHMVIL